MNTDDGRRLDREDDLLESCLWLGTRLHPDARRHLHHGFIQRLLMLQAGRLNLLEHADPADVTPRGPYVGTELSLQANAYYLKMRGALDNLAWCLQFQLALIPGATEATGRQRTSVYLFHREFLSALAADHSDLKIRLTTEVPWSIDLSKRRDPAAHRIPLQVPPAVLSEQEATDYQRADDEAADLIRSGQRAKGMERLHSSTRLGTFRAWLVQSTANGPELVDLHLQIARDHDAFLSVGEAVIDHLRGLFRVEA